MIYEDAKRVVERIASTGQCDNLCNACPLMLMCNSFKGRVPLHNIAYAWLGKKELR